MNDWNSAVKKFLEHWANKKEFEGAVLSGSYAVETQSKNSDIDVMIVLSDKTKWWQRGNQVVDGFLIEYIADP
ncbi:MAG: nucleotidyltransferase domain-containing protein, partial [bacterium]|nr:nucleotidyltransferase domain-containing protein [bacterium]